MDCRDGFGAITPEGGWDFLPKISQNFFGRIAELEGMGLGVENHMPRWGMECVFVTDRLRIERRVRWQLSSTAAASETMGAKKAQRHSKRVPYLFDSTALSNVCEYRAAEAKWIVHRGIKMS
jgi:hypothetical protein